MRFIIYINAFFSSFFNFFSSFFILVLLILFSWVCNKKSNRKLFLLFGNRFFSQRV